MAGAARAAFNYCLSNPPFGMEWKKVEREVRGEHATTSTTIGGVAAG